MIRRALHDLLRDEYGAMAIETVIVAPLLVLMGLGAFEAGTIVSRQQEIQSAASEAESVILAASTSSTGADSNEIEAVIEESLDLASDKVTLQQRFRCNTATNLVSDASTCSTADPIYQYVLLQVSDTYTPVWTRYGVGSPVNFSISRTVQVQ